MTIRISDAHGRLVKKAVVPAVPVDSARDYDFICRLPNGTYRFAVAATDAAGNPPTAVAVNMLVVR